MNLLLGQPPWASSGPRARSGRKGLTSSSVAHSPHPLRSGALPSRPPHPLGVSQPWAGGTAWLGTQPAEKGTPSLPGKGRGDTVRAGGGRHKFCFQTALTFGLGLPSRCVLLRSCQAAAYLLGRRVTSEGHPPGAPKPSPRSSRPAGGPSCPLAPPGWLWSPQLLRRTTCQHCAHCFLAITPRHFTCG